MDAAAGRGDGEVMTMDFISSGPSLSSSTPQGTASPAHYSRYNIPKSLFPAHGQIDEFTRASVMTQYLYRRFREQGWLEIDPLAKDKVSTLGVAIRADPADLDEETRLITEPSNLDQSIKSIATKLNLHAVATMSSEITSFIFRMVNATQAEFMLTPNKVTVPVVESLDELATGTAGVVSRDFCCLVRRERIVLVWSHTGEDLLHKASDVESKIMGSIWGASIAELPSKPHQSLPPAIPPAAYLSRGHSRAPSKAGSRVSLPNGTLSAFGDEKNLARVDDVDLNAEDNESLAAPPRPFLLSHSIIVGCSGALITVLISSFIAPVAAEIHLLGTPGLSRLAFLAPFPIYAWFMMFFCTVVVCSIVQIVGPLGKVVNGNTRFYSSRAPNIKRHPDMEWPHITIQMPVYKEGLKGVIIPTLNSVMAAIRHYENLGGTASVFVCEDGMQAVPEKVSEMRKKFYRLNNVGWCARPPHTKNGFQRAGKFKKASNINYCLEFTLRVEDELLRLLKEKSEAEGRPQEDLTIEEEDILYQTALESALEHDEGRTWAEGNIRMGEIILLIDCDTRVPVDCLHLAAMEMKESPDVAILQHSSSVMQVAHTVFENAITYFTNLIYLYIRFSVGYGDCAPFVGHNAFLRWKAIQSVSFEVDGVTKFWSENHVSEDFDMALRLQAKDFVVRFASYSGGEFKEGVSLTAIDELLRWEKYAYGCSELVFNPLYQWIYRGPFNTLFLRFLVSPIKTTAKVALLGYIGTYYALGSALPLTIVNYFVIGWFDGHVDHSYLPSWNQTAGTVFVFMVASPICVAIFRQRIGEKNFFLACLEAFTWMPLFLLFFSGLSWHISYALLAHLFCLPIEWTSTAKELEEGGFFVSVERVIEKFKYVIVFMFMLIGCLIYFGNFAPSGYLISGWYYIVPISLQIFGHLGLPIFTLIF